MAPAICRSLCISSANFTQQACHSDPFPRSDSLQHVTSITGEPTGGRDTARAIAREKRGTELALCACPHHSPHFCPWQLSLMPHPWTVAIEAPWRGLQNQEGETS